MGKLLKNEVSIVQIICSVLILVAYFLPWLDISLLRNDVYVSYVSIILKLFDSGYSLSSLSGQFDLSDNGYALWIGVGMVFIMLVSILNLVLQCQSKSPLAAFYFNIIPVAFCVSLGTFCQKNISHYADVVSVGFYITFICGIISAIAAWTTISLKVFPKYIKYIKVLSLIVLVCNLVLILDGIIYALSGESEFLGVLLVIISIPVFMLFPIMVLHVPFLMYSWTLILFTINKQIKMIPLKQEGVYENLEDLHVEGAGVDRAQVEILHEPSGPEVSQCPGCGRPIEPTWHNCPNCGKNLIEPKEKDDDNLRFAPPEYR